MSGWQACPSRRLRHIPRGPARQPLWFHSTLVGPPVHSDARALDDQATSDSTVCLPLKTEPVSHCNDCHDIPSALDPDSYRCTLPAQQHTSYPSAESTLPQARWLKPTSVPSAANLSLAP